MKIRHAIGLMLLLGALVLSAVGPASASAAECPGTGTGVVLCSGGHVQEGTFGFTAKAKKLSVNSNAIGTIECTGSTGGSGQFVATKSTVEMTKLIIEWGGCTLPGTTCTVQPIVIGVGLGLHGAMTLAGKLGEVTLSTATERTEFAKIKITGCTQAIEGKITGTQVLQLPLSTSEATIQSAQAGVSHLSAFGGKAVIVLFNGELELSSGKAFSFQKS
jgi:hypothetical protein